MIFRRNKSIVGLDLGSQSVKAVEITLEGPEPVVTGFSRIEVPPDSDRLEAVGKAIQKGRFRSKNVATSVSGQSVVVRYIQMLQMSDSELRQAIRFESDKYLPFDPDEVVLDCQKLSRTSAAANDDEARQGEQMNVVLAACRTSEIHERLSQVTAHGLQPVAVDVDAFALANAWELCGLAEASEAESERVIALVDVGASLTQINVLVGDETCFSREIGIGGADMTQAIARRLGVEAP